MPTIDPTVLNAKRLGSKRRSPRNKLGRSVGAATTTAMLLLAVACGGGSDSATSPDTEVLQIRDAQGAEAVHFETVEEIIDHVDLVVQATVIAEDPEALAPPPCDSADPGSCSAWQSRTITLRIDEVLAGEAPGEMITVVEGGWEDGWPDGTPMTVNGVPWSFEGDVGIFFLDSTPEDTQYPTYSQVNSQGKYLFRGDAVVGQEVVDPTNPPHIDELVLAIHQLTPVELKELVREAARTLELDPVAKE